ncbi:hypothetical protein F0L74_28900 [Chitinophaga agrisoli]|uniref:HlyD family secretion protein n=1 Tax=Chitinophaga agrisoli TaxID=2607653 RepID=A0A5B2VNA5_9BACT|nr:hypothetical protein [Chitinophaga agrisoli]KAA2240188.1 hypothetical protein F0L74_28900 [Chitinophaga agrisoli]
MPVNNTIDTGHDEVLGEKPVWFIRYGNLILLIMVLGCLSFTAIIHYPDVMQGRVEIRHAANAYTVTARLPVYGAGKIVPGQRVYIILDKYPAAEFGELLATVTDKPVQDTTGMVTVKLRLSTGLQSTRGQTVGPDEWATGACSIVVSKERVFKKLLRI